jgi:hypothetical protein
VSGKPRTYRLTLAGVDGRGLAFDDRPERSSRPIAMRFLLDKLFGHGQAPPNAAINATLRDGRQALMPVELGSPRYRPAARTLSFVVRELRYEGDPSARESVVLPRRFGATSLFIDDCCTAPSGESPVTVFNPGPDPLTVTVNFGQPFSVSGTGSSTGWSPGTPNAEPSFSQQPGQGVFGPGSNTVQVQSANGQAGTLDVVVPSTAVDSLQLYLFGGPGGWHWTLCDDGVAVASG